jgi:hypothetical protein
MSRYPVHDTMFGSDAGTSEGARKAAQTRKQGGGHPVGQFNNQHLDTLRHEMSRIKSIDPSSSHYKKMVAHLDTLSQPQLHQLHQANIPFMSKLARNRIKS